MHLIDKILPGFSWVALANVFRQVQQVVALVVYSYFLSPSDFGLFSIVLIFSLFAGLFSNFGTSSAVIYFNDKSKEFLSTIFIFNIIIGFIVFVILNTSSIYVADFFNKPELNSLIKYISINFIFQSLFLVHKALLEMDMSFKVISFIETISIFSATIMGIFFVYKYDVGVYGLVIQSVVNTFLLLILFWSSSKWRPILYFSFPQIKKVYAYAINLTLFNMLNYFTNNIDQFRSNSGYFSEYHAQSLNEISKIINNRYQTLSYYGFQKKELTRVINEIKPYGIDRIVPIGKTTDFSLLWDGYNIIDSLTRKVEIL